MFAGGMHGEFLSDIDVLCKSERLLRPVPWEVGSGARGEAGSYQFYPNLLACLDVCACDDDNACKIYGGARLLNR